jgi:hypothetical protein
VPSAGCGTPVRSSPSLCAWDRLGSTASNTSTVRFQVFFLAQAADHGHDKHASSERAGQAQCRERAQYFSTTSQYQCEPVIVGLGFCKAWVTRRSQSIYLSSIPIPDT